MKRDKTDIFTKTTGRPENTKKNGTVPFKTVRMVNLIMENKLTEPVCDQINLKVNDDNQEKHKRLHHLLREFGTHPRKVRWIFMVASGNSVASNFSKDGPQKLYSLGILRVHHNIQSLGNKVMALNGFN